MRKIPPAYEWRMFMEFKFSQDSSDSQPENAPGEKKNQSALLVLLLVLVGGFAYLYFFTSLIRPLEEQKPAPAPAAAPQAVKMPLPPRVDTPAAPAVADTKTLAPPAPPKSAVPAVTTAPPAKPAAVATTAPAKPPAAAKPKEESKKTPDKKPQPPAAADKKPASGAVTAVANKTAATTKKSEPAKESAKKAVVAVQTKSKPVAKAPKTAAPDSLVLVVGNYVLEEALSADMARVRKAGFEPVVKSSTRKKSNMNRLFVAEYTERVAALSTLEKLKRHTSDAFVIEQGGKFAVYAGSYLRSESARSEKERLKSAGFSTTVKHTGIAIPSQTLSVGPFDSRKAADAARRKLTSAGVKAAFAPK